MIELILAAALPLMGGENAHVKAKIADCDRYAALNPHFPKAFAFLKRTDLADLKPGRYEIDGSNCWAMVQEAKLTPFADGAKVEAHRRYIDIQAPITGEETIGEVTMDEKLRALPFNEKGDIVLFDTPSRPVTLKPGEFAIYFPPDGAHAPGHSLSGERTIRKLVIKVRAADVSAFDRNLAVEYVNVTNGVKWIDGRALPVEGRAFNDVEHYYDRLPSNVTEKVNAGVRFMKHHTAGLQFRFATDAAKLHLRWTPYDPNAVQLPHMPATAVSGLDVYRYDATQGRWLHHATGQVKDGKAGGSIEFGWTPGETCLVNLPLYNGIRSFELGVAPSNTVTAAPPRKSGVVKPVVFYGTSITQGAAASRPGLSFVNIVGRRLDVPVVNLGFSGCGRMELEMSEHLARIDASCYVLDCLWNMSVPWRKDGKVEENYEPFVRNLRKLRPDVPIVMAERCDVHLNEKDARNDFIRALYGRLVAEGWTDLHYLPKDRMYANDGEGTVEGVHPNDRGMMSLADAFGAAVGRALSSKFDR